MIGYGGVRHSGGMVKEGGSRRKALSKSGPMVCKARFDCDGRRHHSGPPGDVVYGSRFQYSTNCLAGTVVATIAQNEGSCPEDVVYGIGNWRCREYLEYDCQRLQLV